MSMASDIAQDRKDRPAYVRFERVAVEDKAASLAAGRYVAKDVDMAYITPPYSRDIIPKRVTDWFEQLKSQVAADRMPAEWAQQYRRSYEAWKNGQELPLKGTPIKGWGVISPAQQETLIRMNILTVEDLRDVNDEGMRHIGLGGLELKNKANAWLSQMDDKGGITLKMAALEQRNAELEGSVSTLQRQVTELLSVVKAQGGVNVGSYEQPSAGITAADLLEDEPVARVKRGRPPKVAPIPEEQQGL